MHSLVLQKAREYVKRGWSVIPIQPKSKSPAIPSWKEYQSRLPTDAELVDWFDGPKASRNIAVVTGAVSKIAVLDFDGDEGIKTLQSLGIRSGCVSTTGKGRHLVFSRPAQGVGNGVRTLPGVDIRGDGGYILVAPSTHPSGRKYAWASYSTVLPDFPKELVVSRQIEDRNEPGWVAEALDSMAPGNRRDTLLRVIGKLVHDKWDEKSIMKFLEPTLERFNEEGVDQDAFDVARDIVRDLVQKEASKPQDAKLEYTSQGAPTRITGISGSGLLASQLTTKWAIQGVLPNPGIMFLFGMQGIGKTWMTLDMAVSFSTGEPWMELFGVPQPKRVLYVDDESFQGLLADRLRLVTSGRKFDPTRIEFIIKPGIDLRNENDLSALRQKIEEVNAEVVIFDSYSCFHTGDDNSSEHTLVMMGILKKLAADYGLSMVIVDHMATSAVFDKTRAKTSNDIAGNKIKVRQADSVVSLERKDGLMTATHVKSRHGREVAPFFVHLKEAPGSVYPTAVF